MRIGPGTPLSTVLDAGDCDMVVGNPWCTADKGGRSDYELCNATWHAAAMRRFCTDAAFPAATLGELRDTQRWPREDPEATESDSRAKLVICREQNRCPPRSSQGGRGGWEGF